LSAHTTRALLKRDPEGRYSLGTDGVLRSFADLTFETLSKLSASVYLELSNYLIYDRGPKRLRTNSMELIGEAGEYLFQVSPNSSRISPLSTSFVHDVNLDKK
jgi:hypothetical protein